MQNLRANNISCDYDFAVKSIKSQFKSANKRNAKYARCDWRRRVKKRNV